MIWQRIINLITTLTNMVVTGVPLSSSTLPDLLSVLVGVLSVELLGDPFLANTAAGFSGRGGLAYEESERRASS